MIERVIDMKNNKTIMATFAALIAQVIFGFSFMFTKIALGYASPMTVIADRYIAAFLGLSVVMILKKVPLNFGKNVWKLILMSVFQPVLYFLFESYGIDMTTSAFSSIMISLIPIVSMISGIFILKEIPAPLQYLFAVLSVGGVVVMALSGNADGTVTILGIILLLGAVLSSVGYNIASRKISKEFSAFERTYAMTIIGLVFFVSVAFVENIHNPVKLLSSYAEPSYTIAILYLGVVSSVVAFLLLNYANTYLPVTKTTVFANVTTVVSIFAGVLFLDEKLSFASAISATMIIIGVCGVQMIDMKKQLTK